MQSIPASPDGSAAGANSELSAAQEKPAGIKVAVSTPVINSAPTRGKIPFAADAICGSGVEKAGAQANPDVETVQTNKPYQKRGINLFVAECYSPAGEKIYVGMELIDEKNLVAAQLYASGGRSLVRGVASIFERALRGTQAQDKTDNQLNLLGIRNRDHVRELTEKPSKDDSYDNRGEEIMASVHGAAAGFSPTANGMQYLTYASSQPIPEAGLLASLPTECCLEDRDDLLRFFREKYGHLIMSVVSRLASDGETLENRGC